MQICFIAHSFLYSLQNSAFEYKIIRGNAAEGLPLNATNVIPFNGYAVLNKVTHKADIHLSCTIELLNDKSDNKFYFINISTICKQLGINSLDWNSAASRVQIEGNTTNYSSGASGKWGRTGLCLQYFQDNRSAGVARAYSSDLNIYGSWPLSDADIFKIGNTYYIDVWGAAFS